jgi:DNA-binding response OmpR family regulator
MGAYVLAVDDDPDVLSTLSRVLIREGLEVDRASSGEEALRKVMTRRPDMLILDIMMPPGMDGLTLCSRLRHNDQFADLPILFLTARGSTDDVVAGLDAGGDDYVMKPFELPELTARVRALLRRSQHESQLSVLELGPLRLDSATYQASVGDKTVQLTSTEHKLLRYMMEHPNQALSPQRLLEAVWDYPPHTGDPDLVRAHIRNLRVKIEALHQGESALIRTMHGVGYMVAV